MIPFKMHLDGAKHKKVCFLVSITFDFEMMLDALIFTEIGKEGMLVGQDYPFVLF